jgi:hypothetical protein
MALLIQKVCNDISGIHYITQKPPLIDCGYE